MLQRTLTLAADSRTLPFNRELRTIHKNSQPCSGATGSHKFIAPNDISDPHETIVCRLTRKYTALGIGAGDLVFVNSTNTRTLSGNETYLVKNSEGELYLVTGQLLNSVDHDVVLGSLIMSCPGGKSLRYSPKIRVLGRYRRKSF